MQLLCRTVGVYCFLELGFRFRRSVMQLLMRSGSSYKMVLLVSYLGKNATLTFLAPPPLPHPCFSEMFLP